MARCEKQVFGPVTREQFGVLLEKGAAMGVPIAGESGQATQSGVTVSWAYDAASGTLTLECTDRPFFVPCSMIDGKIQSAVAEILGQTKSA